MKAVQAIRWLSAGCILALVGCGNGSVKSPDYEATTTVQSIDIQPAVEDQTTTLHVGTTLKYRAIATVMVSAPPGQTSECSPCTQDVTDAATWESSNEGIATVDKGTVTGVSASTTPVVIKATYKDKSDSVSLIVGSAVLTSVVYAKPVDTPRSDSDSYSVLGSNTIEFELYGRFSDQSSTDEPQLLDNTKFGVEWTSSDTAIATNTTGGTFQALALGTTTITGTVTHLADGSTDLSEVSPTAASAALEVSAANDFCSSEFLKTQGAATKAEPSTACIGCTITDPDNVIDGDVETEAAMNVPLSLLGSGRLSLDVYNPTGSLPVGQPAGFILSRSADILAAQLLSTFKVETLKNCNADGSTCEVAESFDPSGTVLHLSLLGLLGAEPQYLLSTPALSEPANGLRLTFGGGTVGLLNTLHVQSACSSVAPPASE